MSNFLSLIEEDDSIESVQLIVCRRGALDAIVIAIKNFILDTTIVSAGWCFHSHLQLALCPSLCRCLFHIAGLCLLSVAIVCRYSRS